MYSYTSRNRSMSGMSSIKSVRDYLMDTQEEDEEEEAEEEGEEEKEEEDEPGIQDYVASIIDVDLSKYDNVDLEDIHLDVRPRIKNIIEELYTEHDWIWPPAPAKDIRKLRFFKRKKKKLLYNKETMDFATFLSIIIGPMELYVAIIFTLIPKTFILAMRECVEITALIIVVFFVQGLYHIYAGILGLALRASRPFEIGYVYPHWRFQVACPLLAMFGIFAAMYMTQDWMVEKEMIKHLKGYNFHWYSKHMWDYYQSFMRCCGVQNYKDWKYHGPIMYDEKRERTLGVPESCCYISNCSWSPNEGNVYSGCFDKTIYTFWTLYIVGAACVGISFILLCIGHKSIQESSRYNGDPIHKLLFDDRWSKKRLHNRSNRREELFSLLNHYCLILGKELGFDEEVGAAKKEDAEREREDQEMEQETALYEALDSYTGNSPPTPNSAAELIDDLHLARKPIEPLPELPKENDVKADDEKDKSKDAGVTRVIEWKPSVNATNDEFPLRSEINFKDQEFTVLPSIIKVDSNTKAKIAFKNLEEKDELQQELESDGKSVTEIPKISSAIANVRSNRNVEINLEPELYAIPETLPTTNESDEDEDPSSNFITINDVASTSNLSSIPEAPGLIIEEEKLPDDINNENDHDNSASEPLLGSSQTDLKEAKQDGVPEESVLKPVEDSLEPEEKVQPAVKNPEETGRARLSRIPTHNRTAPAYFKSALEHDQAHLKLESLRKDQQENIAGLENILKSTIQTKPLPEKHKPAGAFKDLVAVLNKSSSLTKLQQPENTEKLNLELKKSHEFDGSTQVSSQKDQVQKGKKSGIPTASPDAKGPKQHIPLLSKMHFPKRVGEKVTSDSDQEGRVSPRAGKESRLPKRSKPTNK